MSEVEATDTEWLSAKEALLELAQDMRPQTAMAQIPDALRVGKVRARAKLAIVTPCLGHDPVNQRFDDHIVPTEWWLPDRQQVRMRGGSQSKLNFDAGSYDAITSLDGKPHHISLKLLQLSAGDLRSYFGTRPVAANISATIPPTIVAKNQGGAPRDSEKWDAVIVAIARFASEGRLDPSMDIRFKSQAEMRREILSDAVVVRLGVSEDTIKPTVRKVFAALLDGGEN